MRYMIDYVSSSIMGDDTLTIVKEPKHKTKVKIQTLVLEEKQVIVHCSIPCEVGMGVRIWKTTYLVTEDGVKIPLLFWDGITLAPMWTPVFKKGNYKFTLIFAGLPADCKVFSMVEQIPEPGGFEVRNIRRNKADVYNVTL